MGNCRSGAGNQQDSPRQSNLLPAHPSTWPNTHATKNYFDSLYGPTNVSDASPYHPLSAQPVVVPRLFDLALEQLCVSLVDAQALRTLVEQQQRKRRGSLKPVELEGLLTPHTPSAAAIWAHASPIEKGYNGATRRYSSADATSFLPPIHFVNKKGKSDPNKKDKKNKAAATALIQSPFHAHSIMQHATTSAPLTPVQLKRSRSLSLSSKESPELLPQVFTPGANRSNNNHVSGAWSAASSTNVMRRESAVSSAANSSGRQMPLSATTSPVWLGMVSPAPYQPSSASSSSYSPNLKPTSPPANNANTGRNRSNSTSATPVANSNLIQSAYSVPLHPTQSWSDPPDLMLPSRLDVGGGGQANFRSVEEVCQEDDAAYVATNALLTAGSISVTSPTNLMNGGSSFADMHRSLRLPDSLIQMIFDRMIKEELLNESNIHLFCNSNLSTLDFTVGLEKPNGYEEGETNIDWSCNQKSKYAEEITDEWMHVLLENVVRHHHRLQAVLQQQQIAKHKHLIKRSAAKSSSVPVTPVQSYQTPSKISPPPVSLYANSPISPIPLATPFIELANIPTPNHAASNVTAPNRVVMQDEEKDSASPPMPTPNRGILAGMRQDNQPNASTTSSTPVSPQLQSSNSQHHGSIAALSLERQMSSGRTSINPEQRPRSFSTSSVDMYGGDESEEVADEDNHSHHSNSLLAALSPTFHKLDPLPNSASTSASTSRATSPIPLTVHNSLSITSPAPSVLLYQYAPTLTKLNLEGCYQLTNRSLQPLQLCLMMSVLNLNHCTQISDELLICVLANKFYLSELQLKGLKGVTNETMSVLSNKLKLGKLCLDSCSISDDGLQSLVNFTQLHHFSVGWTGTRVTEHGLDFLRNNFNLHTVSVAFTGVTSIQFLKSLRMLREVNVSGCRFADPGLKSSGYSHEGFAFPHLRHAYIGRSAFVEIPQTFLHPGLRRLDMSFNSRVTSGKLLNQLTQLANSKSSVDQDGERDIEQINVQFQGSSSSSATSSAVPSLSSSPLSAAVIHTSASTSSSISSSSSSPPVERHSAALHPPAAARLNVPPLRSAIQLRSLILESCCVDNRVVAVIGEHMINLTELNISDTDVTTDGLLSLAPLKQLRTFNFSGCKVSNVSMGVLKHLPHLTDLSMDCPNVTDEGLTWLRYVAGSLKRLDVFETHIGSMGLENILQLRQLQFLEICNGKLTNAHLARIACNLSQLTSLNVCQNKKISDEGLDALRLLVNLKHVNLSGTGVTHKGLAFLQPLQAPVGHASSAATRSTPSAVSQFDSSLTHISLFGCQIKATSTKMKELPTGIQLGIDAGVVSVE